MAIGEPRPVDHGGVADVYYVDTGMFDTEGYTSVYVVDADRPAVVDAGNGAEHELVLDALAALDIAPADLAVVALTHVHLDHAGGAGHLAAACPNATVAVHEIGAPHVIDPARLVAGTKQAVGDAWRYYADPKPIPEDRVRALSDGDVVDLDDRALDVRHAPGHAPHQVVFHDAASDLLFTADAAGIYLPGRDELQPTTPIPSFDLEQSVADVSMLAALDPAVLCYPHFGPAPRGDRLEAYAALLEAWVADVAAARTRFDDVAAIVDHFVERDGLAAVWNPERARDHVTLNVEGVLAYLDSGEA